MYHPVPERQGSRGAPFFALLCAAGLLGFTPSCGSSGSTTEGYTPQDPAGAPSSNTGGSAGKGSPAAGSGGEAAGSGSVSAGGMGAAGSGGASGPIVVGAGGSGGASGSSGSGGSGGQAPLGPPYPIVLAHGFFGFQSFAGTGFVTYFYQVKDHLAAGGETLVFTPSVDPFNDSVTRGGELLTAVQGILAMTGHARVNLVGHSQGGLDARVVAHDHPELVASVTTIATPHLGTDIADVALMFDANPNLQMLLDSLVQLVGMPLYDKVGNKTSLVRSLMQLSTGAMASFNADYPDAPGIPYQSFAGRSNLALGGADCDAPLAPGFVSQFDATVDPVNALLGVSGVILNGTDLTHLQVNDGLVPARSARWGTFRGCVPADHLDEIGQLLGQGPGLGNSWSYLDFYRDLVKLLRAQGF